MNLSNNFIDVLTKYFIEKIIKKEETIYQFNIIKIDNIDVIISLELYKDENDYWFNLFIQSKNIWEIINTDEDGLLSPKSIKFLRTCKFDINVDYDWDSNMEIYADEDYYYEQNENGNCVYRRHLLYKKVYHELKFQKINTKNLENILKIIIDDIKNIITYQYDVYENKLENKTITNILKELEYDTFELNNETKCCVCLKYNKLVTTCNHNICLKCRDNIGQETLCPICRKELNCFLNVI